VYGGCLGVRRRRRTWAAAKSLGEPLTGIDPGISEWGNLSNNWLLNKIDSSGQTQGTETSKYLQEKKATAILQVAASERGKA